jgi:hypothetical protein
MTMAVRLTLLSLLLLAASGGSKLWEYEGHHMIGLVAAEQLPEDVPAFFRAAAEELAWLNYEPDRWKDRRERDLDPAVYRATAPEHYVNLELVPDDARETTDRLAYLEALQRAQVETPPGFLPFAILELTQRVRIGFRLWRRAEGSERVWLERRIINDAGILGHFVADAANPLHTSIHYNGWVGDNPDGYATDSDTHQRVEGTYVRSHIQVDRVRELVRPATRRVDLREAIWHYIQDSHRRVETLYQLDREEPFGRETGGPAHETFILVQLAGGASMLRDLWWTAWVTSASED